MEKSFEINQAGQNIRCLLYCTKPADVRKLIVYGHGFAGHKETAAARKFAERVLTKYKGVGVLVFDLPCHGHDVKKKLLLQDCLTYISLVLEYAWQVLCAEELYYYATSFGGYLVLKYIADHGNPFVKLALRCPAVNMAEVLVNSIMKHGDLEALDKGKNVPVGFDTSIEVNRQFLSDLETADIRKLSYLDYAEDILILHGTKDEVVPFEASAAFADDNVIEFIPVPNADHRFQNPACMEQATKAILQFFAL